MSAKGEFQTLIAAIEAAGLTETLKNPRGLTLFAPTDAAFAKLPPGELDALLQPENKDLLATILSHHLVPGRAMADAVDGVAVSTSTLGSGDLELDGTGAALRVNGAQVVMPDLVADNGVVHAIDEVLLPESARPLLANAD